QRVQAGAGGHPAADARPAARRARGGGRAGAAGRRRAAAAGRVPAHAERQAADAGRPRARALGVVMKVDDFEVPREADPFYPEMLEEVGGLAKPNNLALVAAAASRL